MEHSNINYSESGDEISEENIQPVLLYSYNSETDEDMPDLIEEPALVVNNQEQVDMPSLSSNDCEFALCTNTSKCEWCLFKYDSNLYKNFVSVAQRPVVNLNENNERLENLTENNCYQYGFRNENGINVVDITD